MHLWQPQTSCCVLSILVYDIRRYIVNVPHYWWWYLGHLIKVVFADLSVKHFFLFIINQYLVWEMLWDHADILFFILWLNKYLVLAYLWPWASLRLNSHHLFLPSGGLSSKDPHLNWWHFHQRSCPDQKPMNHLWCLLSTLLTPS